MYTHPEDEEEHERTVLHRKYAINMPRFGNRQWLVAIILLSLLIIGFVAHRL